MRLQSESPQMHFNLLPTKDSLKGSGKYSQGGVGDARLAISFLPEDIITKQDLKSGQRGFQKCAKLSQDRQTRTIVFYLFAIMNREETK
ncbi:hypothetical protein TNIN_348361 [Trichonephila inaurata madagascariensis]|uniref:Uncharacterized protein n=1 Tax=Trichonephila inaurata madagascariensis TaxID=2747483 RepID=A0A8X7CN16_9ARAC|nr:hypothetical protein TNIN_348361 [Trichonephila inaurata madagascariensis]